MSSLAFAPEQGENPPEEVELGGWLINTSQLSDFLLFRGQGLRRHRDGEFPMSITATSEPLPRGLDLEGYMGSQVQIVRHYLPGCTVNGESTRCPTWADEARCIRIRPAESECGAHAAILQLYARAESTAYILSVTGSEAESSFAAIWDLLLQRSRPAPTASA